MEQQPNPHNAMGPSAVVRPGGASASLVRPTGSGSRHVPAVNARAKLASGPGSGSGFRSAVVRKGPAARFIRGRSFRCRAETAADANSGEAKGIVRKLTGEELEAAIQGRDRPLVIDFYATWCGPCLLMAKELEAVARELGPDKVTVVKVDTDENPELSSQLQIQGLPTLVFVGMDPNKPALRTEGLLPAATVKDIILNEL